jgi:hypothetical protein
MAILQGGHMADNDDNPVTNGQLKNSLTQVGQWMNGTEAKILQAIQKLQDDVDALRTEIAHLK